MANIDLWQDLPDNLSGYKGYTYDVDLRMRYEIRNGESRVLKQALDNFEKAGIAEPLTATNYWNTYGHTLGSLNLFGEYFNMMNNVAGFIGVGPQMNNRSYNMQATPTKNSGNIVNPAQITPQTAQPHMSSRIRSLHNKRMMKGKKAN